MAKPKQYNRLAKLYPEYAAAVEKLGEMGRDLRLVRAYLRTREDDSPYLFHIPPDLVVTP